MGYKKAFLVDSSEIEGRLDPLYYSGAIYGFIKKLKFDLVKVKYISKNISSGIGAGKQDQTDKKNGILQIRPTNIDKYSQLKFDKNIYIPNNDKLKKLQKNDILFNNTNSQELVGKTSFFDIDEEMTFSNHITKIEVNQDIIEAKYLYLLLNIYQENKIFYNLCTNWNNQSGVGIALLKNLKIPLPPKETQNKIIQIMDNAYKIKKENESKAKELLASIDSYLLDKLDITLPKEEKVVSFKVDSSEIFGSRFDPNYQYNKERTMKSHKFNEKYLSEISFIFKGQSITKSKVIDGIYPVIAGGQTSPYNSNVYNYEKNIITISASGAYAGYVWYHDYNIFASDCSIVKSKDNVLPKYLFEILKLKQKEIYKLQHGSAQPHIYPKDIKSIKIPLPPLSIQNEIASHIQSLRDEAKELKKEVKEVLTFAKKRVEEIVLRKEL